MISIYLLGMLLSFGADAFATESSASPTPTNQSKNNAIFSPEQATQLRDQITQWENYLTNMTPQQLQITANIAYIFYATALCELTNRTYNSALVRCIQKIQEKQKTAESDATQELAFLKVVADRLPIINQQVRTMNRTLQEAITYIDSNAQNQSLQPVIVALQSLRVHSQQLLLMYADNNKQEIDNFMMTSAETLTNTAQTLHTAAKMYKKPQELNKLLPEVLPENKEVAKIEIASKLAEGITGCGWQNITIAQNTMQYLLQLLRVTQIVYGSYYQEIYNYMKTKDDIAQYQTAMFSEKGLLPAEYRSTALPTPQELAQQLSLR